MDEKRRSLETRVTQLQQQLIQTQKQLAAIESALETAKTDHQQAEKALAQHQEGARAYQDHLLAEIDKAKTTYRKLEAENAEISRIALQTRATLEAKQNSLLVRLGRQWWIRKDRLLPPSSVRRKAYDYGMRKFKHLMNVPADIPGTPTNGSKASVIWGQSSASHSSDSPQQDLTNLSDSQVRTPLQTENGCVQVPHEWRNADKPAVVVAVLTWNKCELLQNCLQSIFATTSYPYYRVCVFNQASEDGTREYMDSLGSKVDVVHSPQNVGFIPGNNFMMQHYPDWDVVLLNDDTVVTEGWLEKLIECAYSSENIGIVGPKLIYPDGRLQEAGSVVYRDGSARARGKYEDQWNIEYNQICEVDYISACCNYIKRQAINTIGYLDEQFKPSTYEDSDYAFRAHEAGFKVVYQPYSTVIHLERQTIGDDAFRRMEINKKKFAERWRHRLAEHPKSLWEGPEIPGKTKILVVARTVPDYDRSSGGFRFYQFLRILSRHYNVVYAYLDSYVVDEYVKPLKRLGITAFWRGYARSVGCEILDLGAILRDNDFKVVIFALYDVAAEHLSLAKQYAPQAKIIVDTYDVHFLREMREAELKNSAELRQRARRTKKRELETYRAADLVFTVTNEDRRCLLAEDPKLSVDVVPNIHVLPEQVQDHTNRQGLLFVGGFSHPPNIDAVVHFCQGILPLVKRSLPEIQTHIVGNAPPFEVIALGKDGVHVTGHVPNIRPYLESALVSIAPIRFGSGMKGKVGEALAYGVPVVTTSIAAEGMSLEHENNALIADTPKEFAEAIVRLHQDEELWNRLARQGREHVQQNWSFDQVDKKLQGIIARMLNEQVETAPTVVVGGAKQSL